MPMAIETVLFDKIIAKKNHSYRQNLKSSKSSATTTITIIN